MTEIAFLLDDVTDRTDLEFLPSRRTPEAHDCDSCGEAKPDVDLWAEDCETGEQVWLCMACGGW